MHMAQRPSSSSSGTISSRQRQHFDSESYSRTWTPQLVMVVSPLDQLSADLRPRMSSRYRPSGAEQRADVREAIALEYLPRHVQHVLIHLSVLGAAVLSWFAFVQLR